MFPLPTAMRTTRERPRKYRMVRPLTSKSPTIPTIRDVSRTPKGEWPLQPIRQEQARQGGQIAPAESIAAGMTSQPAEQRAGRATVLAIGHWNDG